MHDSNSDSGSSAPWPPRWSNNLLLVNVQLPFSPCHLKHHALACLLRGVRKDSVTAWPSHQGLLLVQAIGRNAETREDPRERQGPGKRAAER